MTGSLHFIPRPRRFSRTHCHFPHLPALYIVS
ncbi:hypothetical protein RAVI111496_22410 [Rahnella victoriana]